MDGRRHCSLSPMIIDDLDLVGVALAKFETNSPSRIHGHRPLAPALTLKLVQADALKRTEVVQSLGYVERQQQVVCGLEIKPTKLVRSFAFPDLAGRGIAPRPDHGINILRITVKHNRRTSSAKHDLLTF